MKAQKKKAHLKFMLLNNYCTTADYLPKKNRQKSNFDDFLRFFNLFFLLVRLKSLNND